MYARKILGYATRTALFVTGFAMMMSALAGSALADAPIPPAPEVDPGSMASAMTLLVGGTLSLMGRVRRGR